MLDDVPGRPGGEGEAATSIIECDQDARRRLEEVHMQLTKDECCACLMGESQPPRGYECGLERKGYGR
jgi:hypothetical protein